MPAPTAEIEYQPSDLALEAPRAFWTRDETATPLVEVSFAPSETYHSPPIRGLSVPSGQDRVEVCPEMLDPTAHWRHLQQTRLPSRGNLLPTVMPLGIPWMAAIVGCPLFCRRSDPDLIFVGDIWAEPIAENASELLDKLTDPQASPWYHQLLRCTNSLVETAGPSRCVARTLLRGPSDMLGQALGDECMATEFVDHPEEMAGALDRLTDIWITVNRAIVALLPRVKGGTVNSYGVWSPGVTVPAQEDHAEILSPRMYRSFMNPCNERMATAFGHLIMHRHAGPMIGTLGRLQALLDVAPLGAVQVTRDINSPPLHRLIEIYALIQQIKPVLVWGVFTRDEIAQVLDTLSPQGLCLKARVESWVEYHRVIQWLSDSGYLAAEDIRPSGCDQPSRA